MFGFQRAIYLLALLVQLAKASLPPLRVLKLHFTARDFMASGCMRPNDIDNYWFGDSNAKLRNNRWINITERCPISSDIMNGIYSGHPDFEASSAVFAQGCGGSPASIAQDSSKPNYTLAIGGISCASIPSLIPSRNPTLPPSPTLTYYGPLTKIVESDMDTHLDGLTKPVYCRAGPYPRGTENNTRRCGWSYNNNSKEYQVSTTGKATFDAWYRDDPRYSKRVGFSLHLTETSPGNGVFQYMSSSFHPFNDVLPCTSTADNRLDCSNGGRVWPRAVLGTLADPYDERTDSRGAFSFTTEMHTFFTFAGNETFEFRGDDDVYIFINEHLALDVGGLHFPAQSVINLTNPYVQQKLGLTQGEVYALDIFHAERKTTGSNFGLTTSLKQECNVIDSAKLEYGSSASAPASIEGDWKLLGARVIVTAPLILELSGGPNSASFAFFKRHRVNMGPGFIATFDFRVVGSSTIGVDGGFAFVLHGDVLDNLNGGTGMNFGFKKNLPTALGIAFDFKANCISMATAKHGLLVHAPLMHPNDVLRDGLGHQVEVRFYGSRPNWMEVYLDEDLYLQKRGINLVDEYLNGTTSAWLGFTSGFGFDTPPPSIQISNLQVRTVTIDPPRTTLVLSPQQTDAFSSKATAFSNGEDRLQFILQTLDSCGNPLSFGGFGMQVQGRLSMQMSTERSIADPSNDIIAHVVDENNGRYRLEFASTSSMGGVYALFASFGNFSVSNGTVQAEFVPPPVTPSPTVPFLSPIQDDMETIRIVGMTLGGVCFLGLVLIGAGCTARKQWRATKKFVKPGREAVAEKEVVYRTDWELDELQRKVAESAHRLNAERARQRDLLTDDIVQLNEQLEQIRFEIRRMKEKKGPLGVEGCPGGTSKVNGHHMSGAARRIEFAALQLV